MSNPEVETEAAFHIQGCLSYSLVTLALAVGANKSCDLSQDGQDWFGSLNLLCNWGFMNLFCQFGSIMLLEE